MLSSTDAEPYTGRPVLTEEASLLAVTKRRRGRKRKQEWLKIQEYHEAAPMRLAEALRNAAPSYRHDLKAAYAKDKDEGLYILHILDDVRRSLVYCAHLFERCDRNGPHAHSIEGVITHAIQIAHLEEFGLVAKPVACEPVAIGEGVPTIDIKVKLI